MRSLLWVRIGACEMAWLCSVVAQWLRGWVTPNSSSAMSASSRSPGLVGIVCRVTLISGLGSAEAVAASRFSPEPALVLRSWMAAFRPSSVTV